MSFSDPVLLYRKKAEQWNAEADKYLAQRDELQIRLDRLRAALIRAETALAATREHNPLDLGPSDTLNAIRDTLAAEKEPTR